MDDVPLLPNCSAVHQNPFFLLAHFFHMHGRPQENGWTASSPKCDKNRTVTQSAVKLLLFALKLSQFKVKPVVPVSSTVSIGHPVLTFNSQIKVVILLTVNHTILILLVQRI